jgi:hypothetical protein
MTLQSFQKAFRGFLGTGGFLEKQFQRRRFLEIDQSKTRIACGGHVCLL